MHWPCVCGARRMRHLCGLDAQLDSRLRSVVGRQHSSEIIGTGCSHKSLAPGCMRPGQPLAAAPGIRCWHLMFTAFVQAVPPAHSWCCFHCKPVTVHWQHFTSSHCVQAAPASCRR